MTTTFKMMDPDCSRTFRTPYSENLVRTGTIGDGSCFFHALLYSLSPSYRGRSHSERMNDVVELRGALAEYVTLSRWKELSNGEMYKMQILSELRHQLSLLCEEPLFQKWDSHYLPSLANHWTSTKLKSLCTRLQVIVDVVYDRAPPFPLSNCVEFLNQVESNALERYKDHLRTAWVDDSMIELVSDCFDCNLHFIQASNRRIYRTFLKNKASRPKNVVFCWIDDSHYESIGEIDSSGKVERVFDSNDELIKKLMQPEN